MAASVVATYSSTDTSADKSITGISWNAGDAVVVIAGTGGEDSHLNLPTNANLTFSQKAIGGTQDSANLEGVTIAWGAIAASSQTSQTISVTETGSAGQAFIAEVWVIRPGAGETIGFGSASGNVTESTISLTVASGSTVCYLGTDWNADAPGRSPATGSGTATERLDATNTGTFTYYAADWVGTSSGTFGFGMSSYTGWKVAHAALEVTSTSSGHTATIGQVVETDIAQPLGRSKRKVVGQVVETSTAQPVTREKRRTVGQVTETDTAQPVSRAKRRTLGQVTETDTAQPVTKLGSKVGAIGQVTETDLAQALTRAKRKAVGQVVETNTAQPVARAKRKTLGIVTETNLAQAVGRAKRKLLGQVTESDLAQAVTRKVNGAAVGQVVEVDIAQPLSRRKRKVIGQVLELDSAGAITALLVVDYGLVSVGDFMPHLHAGRAFLILSGELSASRAIPGLEAGRAFTE